MAERPGAVHHHIIESVCPFRLHHGYSVPIQQRDRFRIVGHHRRNRCRQIRSSRQQGGVFGAGIPEYGGGVNHPASLQRAAFRPRFTLVQKHGKFLLPVEGGQIFQNARRRYRHGKNCKGSTDGGQSFSSRFHRKTSEKMYFLFKGFQKLRQIRKDKLLNHQPFFLHGRDIFYRNLTGAKQE